MRQLKTNFCLGMFIAAIIYANTLAAKPGDDEVPWRYGFNPSPLSLFLSLDESPEATLDIQTNLEPDDPVKEEFVDSKIRFYGLVSPISIGYFVFKRGIEAGMALDSNLSLGIEYQKGSLGLNIFRIDLADFTETLLSFPLRWKPFHGRFYLKFAPGLRQYELSLGDEYMARTTRAPLHTRLMTMDNIVMNYGMGHQWRFQNGFVLDIQWFDLVVAVGGSNVDESFTESSENLRDVRAVQRALRLLERTPTIGIFKFQLGYHF